MQRFLIQCLNGALLVLIFIGLPAATRAQWGNWQVAPAVQSQWLMFWALAVAAAANTVGALGLIKSRKERKLCWEWAAVFGALLAVQYAFNRGYIHFRWLKEALLWLRNRF